MKKLFISLLILFNVNFAFAHVTENLSGGCKSTWAPLRAMFEPHSHTCSSGYYLPANTDECVTCPSNATCNGGTYSFNATMAQGITYNIPVTNDIARGCSKNLVSNVALFTVNAYTCTPGYYVPANHDGCVICPSDSYCPGGTYTFNETVTQGITACASGLFAPAGMWESAQCGRVLHIGDEVVYLRASKKTSPALHVDVDNDGIADFFGNATTADVVMHAGSIHKLKLQVGDTVYSIYDDTIVP